jgi:hypothetical protein
MSTPVLTGDMIAGKSEPGTLASPQVVNAVPRPTVHDDGVIQHRGSIILVISSGAAKITVCWCTSLPLDIPLARLVTAHPGTEMIKHDLVGRFNQFERNQ